MSKPRIDDWAGIVMFPIYDGKDFFTLITEIEADSYEIQNKDILANAFRDGILYGFEVEESDSMFERKAYDDDIFCKNSHYLLPIICVKQKGIIILLWVHHRVKKLKIQKEIMTIILQDDQNIESFPPPKKRGFWKRLKRFFLPRGSLS
jgi:hypothetical protein